ncbi:MAG: hypothetical protein SO164_05215 [Campylobacter sp.]|nr:hypothetical protein [Campylobacter sp.]MDY4860332.1 hypothetical protein [Campylobacter sp.]
MHKNITLNEARYKAFLAKQSFKNFQNGSERVVTNPSTGSSFEVIDQTEPADGFSATVFRNINTNEYTIAYRGTELTDPNDFRTNARVEF